MISLDEFIASYTGRTVSFDKIPTNAGQCVQLVGFYCTDVLGSPVMWKDAAEWWYQFSLPGQVDKVAPENLRRGDSVIWDRNTPGSGGAGHIAIMVANYGGSFISFDSNWGGKVARQITHNWQYVVGGLRIKGQTPTIQQAAGGEQEMIANADQATKIYKILRPNGGASQGEIDGTAGIRSFANFVNDAQPEVEARDANLRAQAEQMQSLQSTINQLNATITQLRSDMSNKDTQGTEKAQQLKDAQDKIAALTAQLSTTHDQIVELQSQSPTPSIEAPKPDEKVNLPKAPWYIKLISIFIPKK